MGDLSDYQEDEQDELLAGQPLLTPEEVQKRLSITRRQLQDLRLGTITSGRLRFIRIGQRTIRFRPSDVLEFEFRNYR